ncbi:MAG: hypothetical protein AB1757_24750 [Acidobacteriota bacterium]
MRGKTISILVTLATVTLLLTSAFGQGTARGRYYTKSQVDNIIKRVETNSDKLKDTVDKSLDRSILDGSNREDNWNEQVKDLEKALDDLRDDFDRRDRWIESRQKVAEVLREADEVGRICSKPVFGSKVHKLWAKVRADLNTLAGVYNLPRIKY